MAAFVQPKIEFVLSHICLSASPAILDVGCGNGHFTYYLQRLGAAVGLDFAGAMLAQNPCRPLVQASALYLPFRDKAFDLVFCANLLHHLGNPGAALSEMARVSKRYVVCVEPNRTNPLMLALGLMKPEERLLLHFTPVFMRSLAELTGLHVLACETMGFLTPNRMPRAIAMLAARFDAPNPLGAYLVLVARV